MTLEQANWKKADRERRTKDPAQHARAWERFTVRLIKGMEASK